MNREFVVFTNKGGHYIAKSKRGLIGILKTIVVNNLYDLNNDPITIWDRGVFEDQSGEKIKDKK